MHSPAVVWHSSLLSYDFGAGHPFNPVRLDLAVRLARELGVLDGVSLLVPEEAEERDLVRAHTANYVDAVKRAPEAGFDVGHGLGTGDTPVFANMHSAASLVVGSTLLAARQLAEGRAKRAVNIAGGLHHAMHDHASGFCVYNDCSVAISWLLDNGFDRIAYIDTDVHHGDGVQAAFYDDPRVLTISLHQHPMTLFPGTGFPGDVGGSGAEGRSVNVALPPRTPDSGWLRAFHAIVPGLLEEFRPQVLLTQCGVDSHDEDPLAELALTVDGHRRIYQELRSLAEQYADGMWLAVGGGGYQLVRVVPRSWTHLMATVLDRDIDPHTPVPPIWMASVGEAAPNTDLPVTMGDGAPAEFTPWDGMSEEPVDTAIRETRKAVYPLHGLDPNDPRD
ncbi:acetoin utilization protein AcuC [Haloechinothrix sp. YIM 98757]|uniref:Acetoin utilization protein AcuC n=1 Tax=Haloechinothrix aidingensis TaxID=2752311 RepID=A0A838A9X5_9PSEU|nr:acetoin utilization protein AcuC [Haloechinothrix aidingensis]MBA0125701.1 acetoin utilization protein AcuC [Haloechinothrix aidingensis]